MSIRQNNRILSNKLGLNLIFQTIQLKSGWLGGEEIVVRYQYILVLFLRGNLGNKITSIQSLGCRNNNKANLTMLTAVRALLLTKQV